MKLLHTLFITAFSAALSASAIAQQSSAPPPAQTPATQTTPAKPAEDLPDAPQATVAATIHPNGPTVVMDTSMGRITCQFYQQQAPKTVANFIGLAEGTID
jgi:peptidyl-prolyl cis-trans isomerase A (cyclophilin A)